MSLKWEDIPMGYKLGVGGTTLATGVFLWMITFFETAESAQQKWEAHNQAIQCRTVYELRTEIRAREERIKFDKRLTEEEKDWLKQQVFEMKAEIRRLDTKGIC